MTGRALLFAALLALGAAPGARAQTCPTTPSACPSPTYNHLTVGGLLSSSNVSLTGGTISGMSSIAGASGGPITGFGTSIGQALGPLASVGGQPGLLIPSGSGLIFNMNAAATDYATFRVLRGTSYTGGTPSNIVRALGVETTAGVNDGANEWNLVAKTATSSTVAGAIALGAYLQGTRNVGATSLVKGSVSQAIDLNDEASSLSGSAVNAQELDVDVNGADDATNAGWIGSHGVRSGVHLAGIRQNSADTAQTQIGLGFWLSTTNLATFPNNDAHTNFGSGFGFGVSTQAYSAFDARGAVAPTGSSNPVYALNMTAGHAIEFKGDSTTLSPAPQRTLLYTSSLLSYQVSGTTAFSVSDAGVVNVTGGFSINGTPISGTGGVNLAVTNTSAGNTGYNAQVGNGQALNVYNTAFGYGALDALTATQEHTAIGYHTLNLLTTGHEETAIGYLVLPRDVSGSFNVGVGSDVMRYFDGSGGIGNTALGHGAMGGDDVAPVTMSAGNNTALGSWSGQEIQTASLNTLVGSFAGLELSTGFSNVAVGVYALAGCNGCLNNIADLSPAQFNIALGTYALENDQADANVAVGYQAAQANISGVEITAVGFRALNLATGNTNTALGYNVMQALTTGTGNVGIGALAMLNATTAANNIAVGTSAGKSMTTASSNVAVGNGAMNGDPVSPVASTVTASVAIGQYSGGELTTPAGNVFTGAYSGIEVQTGAANTATGTWALAGCSACTTPTIGAVTAAANNSAFGYQALMNDTSGVNNVAVGYQALLTAATANQNIGVGAQALKVATAGQNVAMGFQAGVKVSTGTANVLIGNAVASTTLTTGARNILLGTASNCDTAAAGTNDVFLVCASSGSTQLMSGSLASGSLALTVNGNFTATTYSAGASAGVDCTGVTAITVVVTKGIVTHC